MLTHTILYGQTISKLVGNENNCRVWQHALSRLEPCEVKVSRGVLRGLGAGNSPRLPGDEPLIWGVHGDTKSRYWLFGAAFKSCDQTRHSHVGTLGGMLLRCIRSWYEALLTKYQILRRQEG